MACCCLFITAGSHLQKIQIRGKEQHGLLLFVHHGWISSASTRTGHRTPASAPVQCSHGEPPPVASSGLPTRSVPPPAGPKSPQPAPPLILRPSDSTERRSHAKAAAVRLRLRLQPPAAAAAHGAQALDIPHTSPSPVSSRVSAAASFPFSLPSPFKSRPAMFPCRSSPSNAPQRRRPSARLSDPPPPGSVRWQPPVAVLRGGRREAAGGAR